MKKLLKALLKSSLLISVILGTVSLGAMLFESFLYDYKGSSVVMITKSFLAKSGGTGFLIKAPSGKLFTLTNAHICRIGETLVAHKQDGSTELIKVIEIDKNHDLCIMEPVSNIRPLSIADSIDFRERVWLIGHPALRPLTLESGHFAGEIHIGVYTRCSKQEIEKQLEELNEKPQFDINDFEKLIMLTSGYCVKGFDSQYINNIAYGGNSGSPVVNKFGNVVGVLFAGRRDQPTASYTVPLDAIQLFLSDK